MGRWGAMLQHVEMARNEMLFQLSECHSETLSESGTAPMMQASSPMWVNYLELGGNTPPSQTSPGIKEEAQVTVPEDGSVASMLSMPLQILQRQEKQKEKGKGGMTFISISPMLEVFTVPHLIRADSMRNPSCPCRVLAVCSDFTRIFFGR